MATETAALRKRRMGRHVGDALAVDVDLAAVAQGLQVLRAGKGALAAFEDGFRGVWHRRGSVPFARRLPAMIAKDARRAYAWTMPRAEVCPGGGPVCQPCANYGRMHRRILRSQTTQFHSICRLIGREQQDDDEAARPASSRSLRPAPDDKLDAPSPAMTSTAGGRSQELHNLSTAPLRPAADCASYGVPAFSCVQSRCVPLHLYPAEYGNDCAPTACAPVCLRSC